MQDLRSHWAPCGVLLPVPLCPSCSRGQHVILHSCRPRKVRAINHGHSAMGGGGSEVHRGFGADVPQAALLRVRIVNRSNVTVWPLSRCGFGAPDWGTECGLRALDFDLTLNSKVAVRPMSRCEFGAPDWGTECRFWALTVSCSRAQGTWVSRFTSLLIMQGLGLSILFLLQGLGAVLVGILFQGLGTYTRCDPLLALLQGTQERCMHSEHLSYSSSAWCVC